MISAQTIEEVKQKLIKTYKPLEIYIFGSYAWGCPDEDSDLDLLIIIEKYDKNRHQTLVDGHKALMYMDISKDILVLTQEEFEKYSVDRRMLYFKIKQQGTKIYARS